jgi:pimeloyl-ACP methyl ester carboxylesterase
MAHFALLTGLLLMSSSVVSPKEVSFPAQDGGSVYADSYGAGKRGVVLAPGARFDKASWKDQASALANAGFHVLAIDFRGKGKSRGGPNSTEADMYLDVLAAVRYLREHGVTSVAVLGASMGGGAAAKAVVNAKPGEIDRLILLAAVPNQAPERLTVPKLFAVAQGDPLMERVRQQYERSPEPKELLILDGSAHAQFLFPTDQGERLMSEILRFLSAGPGVGK